METRAPFVIVGALVLAAICAIFSFVYWLNNAGGIGARTSYHVQFSGPVPGLLVGARVLFNGIHAGEVTSLTLDADSPRRVNATIAVIPSTPVRPDTKVGLDFQGLTGVPVVALEGGKETTAAGVVTTLVAEPDAGQSMTQAARQALSHIDGILAQNSEPLHNTITNLSTFAEGLARNTSHLDNIVAGLERMTGGGTSTKPKTFYNLTAAKDFPAPKKMLPSQLVIPEPTTILMFDTQRIVLTPVVKDEDPSFANAQWGDSIPKLVQAKLIQSFENFDAEHTPIRPTDGVETNATLLCDIRSFQVLTEGDPAAEVALSVKIVSKAGRVIASRLFQARHKLERLDADAAVNAFDLAFADVAGELVTWTASNVK